MKFSGWSKITSVRAGELPAPYSAPAAANPRTDESMRKVFICDDLLTIFVRIVFVQDLSLPMGQTNHTPKRSFFHHESRGRPLDPDMAEGCPGILQNPRMIFLGFARGRAGTR